MCPLAKVNDDQLPYLACMIFPAYRRNFQKKQPRMKTTGVLGLLLGAATAAPSHHGGLIQPRETRSTSINWSGAVAQGKDSKS